MSNREISIENLEKQYPDNVRAVDGVSLHINGSINAIHVAPQEGAHLSQ